MVWCRVDDYGFGVGVGCGLMGDEEYCEDFSGGMRVVEGLGRGVGLVEFVLVRAE